MNRGHQDWPSGPVAGGHSRPPGPPSGGGSAHPSTRFLGEARAAADLLLTQIRERFETIGAGQLDPPELVKIIARLEHHLRALCDEHDQRYDELAAAARHALQLAQRAYFGSPVRSTQRQLAEAVAGTLAPFVGDRP